MHAEKIILETDAQGKLKQQPKLPPNVQLEAIFLVLAENTETTKRKPSANIAGKGKILGDIVSPAVAADCWEAMK